MQVLEITRLRTGVAKDGVNYLEPTDAFQKIENGFIYRQVLQSRKGFNRFSLSRCSAVGPQPDSTRIMGIFEYVLRDNEKELIVCSKKYLYKYNPNTDLFEQIPFNSVVPPGVNGFNIILNEDYVSGTNYPFANGNSRFVFSSKGMTDIWFYNGTDVKRFTNLVDNPNYQPPLVGFPAVPGNLTNATHVIAFGLRLNLFAPTINGQIFNQSMFFSGINDASGNGDKFAVPGAGEKKAITNEYINGASILGNLFIVNFNRSSWAIEPTTDEFNPYFLRKIPSVIGTDGAFSMVSWFDKTFSVGKTGYINTDGRQQKRFDDKIPFATADDINQSTFQLTYGGFLRDRSQFIFSYQDSGSLLTNTQDKVSVYNYEEESWSINDQRFSVFGQTDVGTNLNWDDIYEVNNPSWLQWDTTEEIWNQIGIRAGVQKALAGDDFGYVYQLDQDYDDYFSVITGISTTAQAVILCDPLSFMIGDQVSIRGVEGMVEINDDMRDLNNWPFITAISPTSITVDVNSTNFTNYTMGGSVSKIINFSATTIPFNPYRSVGLRVYVSHVEFLLDTNAGNLLVSVLQDEQDTPIFDPVPIIPTSTIDAREWITMTVDQEANFLTFVLNQQSPALQVRLTSMRIHYMQGGSTSG